MNVTPQEMIDLIEDYRNLKSELDTLLGFRATGRAVIITVTLTPSADEDGDSVEVGLELDTVIEATTQAFNHTINRLKNARVLNIEA